MHLKVTQYGYPGDPDGDDLTRSHMGGWGNKLTGASCALTDSAVAALGLDKRHHGAKLQIDFPTLRMIRFWDDRAPESEPRLDLYQPGGFDKSFPDFAEVTVITDIGSTEAKPL